MITRSLILFLLFISQLQFASLSAQILSITPVFPTADDTVEIIYDASLGNADLLGVVPVYAHAGLITDQSSSPTDWQYVQGNWGTPDPTVLMQALGNNLHKITYHIRSFHGVPTSDDVQQLAFVFRNADGSLVGRESDEADIYYPVYDGTELEVAFLSPDDGTIVEIGNSLDMQTATSDTADIELFINGSLFSQTTQARFLDITWTPSLAGDYWIKVQADNGIEVKMDSIFVVVQGPIVVEALPSDIEEGINYISDTSIILSLYAPQKSYAYVVGEFNQWQPSSAYQMKRSPDSSTYWLQLTGLTPGQEYAFQYLVDGTIRIADPYADKVLDPWNDPFIDSQTYPNLKTYPSGAQDIVSVLQTAQASYSWQHNQYERPPEEELVIYELLIRDFLETHDYQTLIDTLPYLEKLGINAIELMPIMEFEGNISWGYNPSFFFAPDKYYGPKNDLKAFIDTCHARGIVVLLDMVLNHAFGQNSLVRLYWDGSNDQPAANSPWFNQEATHPFNVGYDFNHESEDTKRFVDRVLAYWLEEYRFDGYRMDLSKGFTQVNAMGDVGQWSQYDASRIALLKRMFDEMRQVDSSSYFILEHFADNSEEKELAEYGMMLWGNHNFNYNEATMGYHGNNKSDFSWINYQQRGWAVPHAVGYMESHDEERLMYKNLEFGNESGGYSVKSLSTALDRIEMAAAFFLTIPGPKLIWQFGEQGYEVNIDFNGRTGPKPIRWNDLNDPDRLQLFKVYQALIDLRKTYSVFQTDNFELSVSSATKRIKLSDPSMNVVIVGNFDVIPKTIDPSFHQTGTWYSYFYADSLTVTDINSPLTLQAGEWHLYTDTNIGEPDFVLADENPIELGSQTRVFPNPSSGQINVQVDLPQASTVNIDLLNMLGERIQSKKSSEIFSVGKHLINWNLTHLAKGTYVLQIQQGDIVEIRKVILY